MLANVNVVIIIVILVIVYISILIVYFVIMMRSWGSAVSIYCATSGRIFVGCYPIIINFQCHTVLPCSIKKWQRARNIIIGRQRGELQKCGCWKGISPRDTHVLFLELTIFTKCFVLKNLQTFSETLSKILSKNLAHSSKLIKILPENGIELDLVFLLR